MEPKYCKDKELRRWVMGPDLKCDGDSEKCRFVFCFEKQQYCGWCPPRCTLWEVIRDQAGCLFCKYYTRKLSSVKCLPCLSSETRINYERDDERVADAAALYERE